MLRLKQAFFTARMQNNIQGSQTELAVINAKISNWYKNESEKISLMSRQADLNQSEKVRIYHHNQHQQFRKRSSILQLETPMGLVEGHEACARALEANVAEHLLKPADLSLQAQETLLK